jgi:hypothetical protein
MDLRVLQKNQNANNSATWWKQKLLKVFRLRSNYFAFLGGIFISVSINLLTGIFVVDTLPNKTNIILISAVSSFLSAFYWLRIGMALEDVDVLAFSKFPLSLRGSESQDIWEKLVASNLLKLSTYLTIASLSAWLSLLVLLKQ